MWLSLPQVLAVEVLWTPQVSAPASCHTKHMQCLAPSICYIKQSRAFDAIRNPFIWMLQDDGDFFTRDELAVDYPKLNTL